MKHLFNEGDVVICVKSPDKNEYSMEVGTIVTVSQLASAQLTMCFESGDPLEWYRQELFIKLNDMYGKAKLLGRPYGKDS